jgi:hypothetical protein
MASIFDMFKSAAAPTAPATNGSTNPAVPNATTVPAAANPAATGEPASPLAQYDKLWETDPNAPKDVPFSFNSDPAKLLETAKSVDFTKTISPEVMARIQAGGSDAQQAMLEAMNSASQLSFAHSSHSTAKIVEQALQAQEQRFKDLLPNLIKQHSVSDSFRNDNPLMNDPALAPMIGALQSQFTKQYPNATAVEIKNHVNEFLNGAADRIQAARPKALSDAPAKPETDWMKYMADK